MTVDLAQFHQLFLDEAAEQLAELEQVLLALGERTPDEEGINHLFRLMHSIKGGAATFGFEEITRPAHELETELDQVRKGDLIWSPALRDRLLGGRDTLAAALFDLEGSPAEAQGPADADTGGSTPAPSHSHDSTSIRVRADRIDELVNLVGELVIVQEMLQLAAESDATNAGHLTERLGALKRSTSALQETVLSIRMVPVELLFQRFPRLVHDLSQQLGKQIDLDLRGETVELDRGMVERLVDPLTHLVRNCLDHGIEPPEQRVARGKPARGMIRLEACHEAGMVRIRVSDDGAGLDPERLRRKAEEKGIPVSSEATREQLYGLIFMPGFSTAGEVTSLSGRGVGMDIVRQAILDLGGSLTLDSEPGVGTQFTLSLPLTMAILDGMQVRVGAEIYVLPVQQIQEAITVEPADLRPVANLGLTLRVRGEVLPVLDLRERLGGGGQRAAQSAVAVVAQIGSRRQAVLVDELLAQQQVVIKSLERNFRRVSGFSGATVLGDGSVALILDLPALLRQDESLPAARSAGGLTLAAHDAGSWGLF